MVKSLCARGTAHGQAHTADNNENRTKKLRRLNPSDGRWPIARVFECGAVGCGVARMDDRHIAQMTYVWPNQIQIHHIVFIIAALTVQPPHKKMIITFFFSFFLHIFTFQFCGRACDGVTRIYILCTRTEFGKHEMKNKTKRKKLKNYSPLRVTDVAPLLWMNA